MPVIDRGFFFDEVDELAVNALRVFSMECVEAARSGHPGAAMALAPVAWVLFSRFLKHDPSCPEWADRDRFVLSCGHASALLYSTLYLFGYGLTERDLASFRQWGSPTPGHPEYGCAPGVEMTTGPLGQGCAASVGMALSAAMKAARYNVSGNVVVDHKIWVLASDGDMMEGVSNEAASLAGHLRLPNIVWIWDDNRITIEGSTELATSEDLPARFRALGWQVFEVDDVNDLESLAAALESARTCTRPALVRVRSTIAWGAPKKAGSASAHGAPLGREEVEGAKRAYGWPEGLGVFEVPAAVKERIRERTAHLKGLRLEWEARFEAFRSRHPHLADAWEKAHARWLPSDLEKHLPRWEAGQVLATRQASSSVMSVLSELMPNFVGGSADLAPSCKTSIPGGDVAPGRFEGRNIHFGIREHAMAGILNGMALDGGWFQFGSTFLVFSDYLRPALRLAAMMGLPVVMVFTHDSVGVGEDGPTHQPVEQLASLRAIPGLVVIRPADANETAAAWAVALRERGPVAQVLTRQGVPVLEGTETLAWEGTRRGGYLLAKSSDERPDIVLVGSGSEVQLLTSAKKLLEADDVASWVVSVPSLELLKRSGSEYLSSILPPGVPVLAVEAAWPDPWWSLLRGRKADVIGLERFGASAPGKIVMEKLGFTASNVRDRALALLGRRRS